jgi:hypothetical protein
MILFYINNWSKRYFQIDLNTARRITKKPSESLLKAFYFAEGEGFEPPDLLQSTVFKTAAFDRSAIPLD